MTHKDSQRLKIDDAIQKLSKSVDWIDTVQAEINEYCGPITRLRLNPLINRLQGMLRGVANVIYEFHSENPGYYLTAEVSAMIWGCLDQAPANMARICDAVPLSCRTIEDIYCAKRDFAEVCEVLQVLIDVVSPEGEG
jgi:hypothetical protein